MRYTLSDMLRRIASIDRQDILSVADYHNTPGAKELAHKVKEGNPQAIQQMAWEMAIKVPHRSVLIPIPSSGGSATITKDIANELSRLTGAPVADVLSGRKRPKLYDVKQHGKILTPDELGLHLTAELPKGLQPILIDNVYSTGTTSNSAERAIPGAKVLVHSIGTPKGSPMKVAITDLLSKAAKRLSLAAAKYVVDVTYEIVTEESAEQGDAEDRGFEEEGVEFDNLHELIKYLRDKGAIHPSASHPDVRTWYSTEEEPDYRTGERKTLSYHINKGLTPEDAKVVFDSIKQNKNLAPDPDDLPDPNEGKEEVKVGTRVRFELPSLHGKSPKVGTVKRLLPDGKFEILSQEGGYHTLERKEINVLTA